MSINIEQIITAEHDGEGLIQDLTDSLDSDSWYPIIHVGRKDELDQWYWLEKFIDQQLYVLWAQDDSAFFYDKRSGRRATVESHPEIVAVWPSPSIVDENRIARILLETYWIRAKIDVTHIYELGGFDLSGGLIEDLITASKIVLLKPATGQINDTSDHHTQTVADGPERQTIQITIFPSKVPEVNPSKSTSSPSDTIPESICKDDLESNYCFTGALCNGLDVDLVELSGLELSAKEEDVLWGQICGRDLLIWNCEVTEIDELEVDGPPGCSDKYFRYECGPKKAFIKRLRSEILGIVRPSCTSANPRATN